MFLSYLTGFQTYFQVKWNSIHVPSRWVHTVYMFVSTFSYLYGSVLTYTNKFRWVQALWQEHISVFEESVKVALRNFRWIRLDGITTMKKTENGTSTSFIYAYCVCSYTLIPYHNDIAFPMKNPFSLQPFTFILHLPQLSRLFRYYA